jgi:hypothetical protein
VASYRATRGLPTEEAASALLSALLDYYFKPTGSSFDTLRQAHVRTGNRASVAEDIGRCVYFGHHGEDDGDVRAAASIAPANVGNFWAARQLHDRHRIPEAIPYYQRALAADDRNPRTRILYAIALLNEQRAADAVDLLQPIPVDWAPRTVTYWRARALLDAGRPRDARAAPGHASEVAP